MPLLITCTLGEQKLVVSITENNMNSKFLTNYTDTTFLATIQANLRTCREFCFSVSFIKKAGLVLLANDIKSALERGAKGKLITSTYQNFTDVESLNFFLKLAIAFETFECHLDDECFYDEKNYSTNGFHTKGYLFEFDNRCELIVGSSNISISHGVTKTLARANLFFSPPEKLTGLILES